jgi:hypothetical protein
MGLMVGCVLSAMVPEQNYRLDALAKQISVLMVDTMG